MLMKWSAIRHYFNPQGLSNQNTQGKLKVSANDINPPRGMRDILPNEMRLRNAALTTIVNTYEKFGFTQIETPAVEDLSILSKDSGSDNTKLIFSILKRGEEFERAIASQNLTALADLGLRYDLTVPLARYYSSNRTKLPSIFKVIQIGPVWRAERPQKGRFRQFHQCDIDILGSNSFYSELELITASSQALIALGLSDFVIRINDRRLLTSLLKFCGFEEVQTTRILITLDKLDKIGIDGVKNELTKYSLNPASIDTLANIISTQTTSDSHAALKHLQETLNTDLDASVIAELDIMIKQVTKHSNNKYKCVFDPTLVRGMGYYTGPIFEITYKHYPYSIAGGGRYDQMIEALIDINVPACGISLGFERLIGILAEEQLLLPSQLETIALIYDNTVDKNNAIDAINSLWNTNQQISIYKKQKNFSKQLNELLANGINKYITLDDTGVQSAIKEITLK